MNDRKGQEEMHHKAHRSAVQHDLPGEKNARMESMSLLVGITAPLTSIYQRRRVLRLPY